MEFKPYRRAADDSYRDPVTFMPGTCDYCSAKDAAPSGGQRHRLCASCRAASYCSKECQKMDWKNHKDLCRLSGNLKKFHGSSREWPDASTGYPSHTNMAYLASQFIHAYETAVNDAILVGTFGRAGASYYSSFDFDDHFVLLEFDYVDAKNDNPVDSFKFKDAVVKPISELAAYTATPELMKARDDQTLPPIRSGNYLGRTALLYNCGGVYNFMYMFHLSTSRSTLSSQLMEAMPYDSSQWVENLRDIFSRKWIAFFPEEHGPMLPGLLVKKGAKWVWERMTPEQMVLHQLPIDLAALIFGGLAVTVFGKVMPVFQSWREHVNRGDLVITGNLPRLEIRHSGRTYLVKSA